MIEVLGFLLVVAAIIAAGAGVVWASRLPSAEGSQGRPEAHTTPLETLVAGAVLGIGLWIAASWALALTHSLTYTALIVLAIAFAIGGALSLRVVRLARPSLLILPVVIWTAFVLWRGFVVPPVNHDALSYHLPKSVLFMRAAGVPSYEHFDHRFPSFPANYELLVADLMILTGSDRITEWIGTLFYLLFLAAAALLAQWWWWRGPHVTAAVLATAAAPVVLLHSGADKNDLMAMFFALAALMFGARWAARGGVMPMAVAVAAGALAVGTKTNAGAIAIGLLPFVAWRAIRKPPRIMPIIATVLFGAIAFVLCGGWVFIAGFTSDDALMGVQIGGQNIGKDPLYTYRSWSNLWRIPLEMLAAGISAGGDTGQISFSAHFGPLPVLLVLLLPFAIWRWRRDAPSEAVIGGLAALLAFIAILPTNVHPPAMPRYSLFVLPVLAAWTIAPAMRELNERFRRYAFLLAGVLIAVFAQQAIDAALNDSAAPLRFVRWCASHPGTREVPRLHEHASMVVDRLAAADDVVALHGDVSTWIHPIFGARLSRPLIMLPGNVTAATIPASAEWVVIERWWEGGRAPRPALHEELLRDSRFELAYDGKAFNQSVFRRVAR